MEVSLNGNPGRAIPQELADCSLLDVLRQHFKIKSVKDGCSPQGQCGCCMVLVDGAARAACVTPVKRVAGREITTLEGLDETVCQSWAEAFYKNGASQCGFCTPGIIMRLEGLRRKKPDADIPEVKKALLANLCRCTGWHSICSAWESAVQISELGGLKAPSAPTDKTAAKAQAGTAITSPAVPTDKTAAKAQAAATITSPAAPTDKTTAKAQEKRDSAKSARRAEIESRTPQKVGSHIPLGHAGFAMDTAPESALAAVLDGAGKWIVAENFIEARKLAGRIQGRRSSAGSKPPLALPSGDWDLTLQTSWTDPGYLELDASWCEPGKDPASALANGGAFGAKLNSFVEKAARELADKYGKAVKVWLTREDVIKYCPKRPPFAAGVNKNGKGIVKAAKIRVAKALGIEEKIKRVLPEAEIESVEIPGPPVSADLRAAGWAEAELLLAGIRGEAAPVVSPDGATAKACVDESGISVQVFCGNPLDEVVLKSFCEGAAFMGYSWIMSERLNVDSSGEIQDLTVRSLGMINASQMPKVEIEIQPSAEEPVNGSDAVFAAVAAAAWLNQGCPKILPAAAVKQD